MRFLAGQKLPPLHERTTRILLLAWSYLDAVLATPDRDARGGKASSRALDRNQELWKRGSYEELEHAIDQLNGNRLDFWLAYVTGERQPNKASHDALAELDKRRMPEFVYVPAAISEAAGYVIDIKKWER